MNNHQTYEGAQATEHARSTGSRPLVGAPKKCRRVVGRGAATSHRPRRHVGHEHDGGSDRDPSKYQPHYTRCSAMLSLLAQPTMNSPHPKLYDL